MGKYLATSVTTLLLCLILSGIAVAEWYEGGTLHNATALEWQQADYANKLATAGDWVSAFWSNERFIPELQANITTMDDIRLLSTELVNELDAAVEEDADQEVNEQLLTNQNMSEIAALIMMMRGWVQ